MKRRSRLFRMILDIEEGGGMSAPFMIDPDRRSIVSVVWGETTVEITFLVEDL